MARRVTCINYYSFIAPSMYNPTLWLPIVSFFSLPTKCFASFPFLLPPRCVLPLHRNAIELFAVPAIVPIKFCTASPVAFASPAWLMLLSSWCCSCPAPPTIARMFARNPATSPNSPTPANKRFWAKRSRAQQSWRRWRKIGTKVSRSRRAGNTKDRSMPAVIPTRGMIRSRLGTAAAKVTGGERRRFIGEERSKSETKSHRPPGLIVNLNARIFRKRLDFFLFRWAGPGQFCFD